MAKILIAGDNSAELRVLTDIFKDSAHELITAADGEDAEQKAREGAVDLVIMETNLPKKNGFHVCRELRADKKMNGMPIIMISSEVQTSDPEWGLKQGANEYIVKPFTPLDVLLAVKKHLRKK
jgi:DNA-binding response OmpR family regulator